MSQNAVQTTLQRKFAGLVLYTSILASLILVLLFGFWRYFQIVDHHQQQMTSLTSEHLTGIENSLWFMDDLQTRRQLNELRLILNIDYAVIINQGEKVAAVGISVAEPLLSRDIEITHTEAKKIYKLGTLRLFIDSHSINKQLLEELLPLLAITLLAVIIPGVLINFNMQKIVSNRLEKIVTLLNQPGHNLDLNNQLNKMISPQDFDEIDRLTEEIYEFHQLNNSLNLDLQLQQHQLKAVFENTGTMLGLLDKDGRFININQTAVNLSNFKKSELLGSFFWEKIWSSWILPDNTSIKGLVDDSLSGSLVRDEICFSSEYGKYYIDISFIPIMNEGRVEFVLVEAIDSTQKKRWETQQQTQVQLLKYFLTENNATALTKKIVADIDQLLPAGINLHIFQQNSYKNILEVIAGGLHNPTASINFQEIVSNLLKTDFSLKGPTTISFDNQSLKLTPEIISLTEILPFTQLYIEPIPDQNDQNAPPAYSVLTINKEPEVSSFVTQLCSMSSSLVGLAIYREKQHKSTREVEENLVDVVNSSLDGILVLDETGKIITANNAFANLLGKDRKQIIGEKFWGLPVNISKSETQALINSTRVSGKQRYQITLENSKGDHYCDLTLVTIGEKTPQFYAFFQDRTQQQILINELEQQFQFINTVLNNTTDGIIACDETGKITLYNNRISELTSAKSNNKTEQEWHKLYQLYEEDGTTKLKKENYPLNISLTEGKIENFPVILKSHTGLTRKLICNGARLYSSSGKILGAVVTAHDISFENKIRIELEQHKNQLEKLVEIRTENLQQANNELEAFANSASHDINAPLRSINDIAKTLNQDYSGLISNSGQNLLHKIIKNTNYLGTLIEELISLSNISRITLARNQVDISKLCSALLKDQLEFHPELQYSVEAGLVIKGDVDLIKLLLKHLISNAIKFSNKSAFQKIDFRSEIIDDECWFLLEDNGVGFDSNLVDNIFKPFQRFHGDDYEGQGIGLSIADRIVTRHHGSISISSEVNKGTLVKFKFQA